MCYLPKLFWSVCDVYMNDYFKIHFYGLHADLRSLQLSVVEVHVQLTLF